MLWPYKSILAKQMCYSTIIFYSSAERTCALYHEGNSLFAEKVQFQSCCVIWNVALFCDLMHRFLSKTADFYAFKFPNDISCSKIETICINSHQKRYDWKTICLTSGTRNENTKHNRFVLFRHKPHKRHHEPVPTHCKVRRGAIVRGSPSWCRSWTQRNVKTNSTFWVQCSHHTGCTNTNMSNWGHGTCIPVRQKIPSVHLHDCYKHQNMHWKGRSSTTETHHWKKKPTTNCNHHNNSNNGTITASYLQPLSWQEKRQ